VGKNFIRKRKSKLVKPSGNKFFRKIHRSVGTINNNSGTREGKAKKKIEEGRGRGEKDLRQ